MSKKCFLGFFLCFSFANGTDYTGSWSYQPAVSKGIPGTHFTTYLTMKSDGTHRQTHYDHRKPFFPQVDLESSWEWVGQSRSVIRFWYQTIYGVPNLDYCIYVPHKAGKEMRCGAADDAGLPPFTIQQVLKGTWTPQQALQYGTGLKGNTSLVLATGAGPIRPCWEGFAYTDIHPKFPDLGRPYLEIWSELPSIHRLSIVELFQNHSGPAKVKLDLKFRDGTIYTGNGFVNAVGSYSVSPSEELTLEMDTPTLQIKTIDQRIELRFGKHVLSLPNRCLAHTEGFYSPRK